MGFTKFGLSDQIQEGVRSAGYAVPTPIQTLAIQPALDGEDIIGCAQTGTGKTAAYVLPMLHRLSQAKTGPARPVRIRGLVVVPTRELAQQVHEAIQSYGRHTGLHSVSIYGGVGMEPQLKVLRKGVDIVVATPGRLLDHLQRGSADLTHVKIVVLDEADRMLDLGFIHDVTKILTRLPADRQTLLFSATVSGEVAKLAGRFLRNPRTLEVGERRSPGELVKQHFYAVPPEEKLNLLVHALSREKMESVLVFSRTKHGADKISRRLEKKGISSAVLHSNRTQGQRQRALEGFRSGRYRILVATDIAARGIDVDGISHVINYDIPQYAEDYVHRIGRTGRAGATGDAMTLVGPGDRQYLKRIEAYTGKTLHVKAYPDFQAAPRQVSSGPRPQHHQKGKAAVKRPPRRSHHASSHTEAKKKKTAPRMETFSSDGGAWSNY